MAPRNKQGNEPRSDNKPSGVNFAAEFVGDGAGAPGKGKPDPNRYRNREDGFAENIVAGGGHPDDGAFTPSFVNGVDHEEVDEDAEAESGAVEDAPEAPVEEGQRRG